MNLLVISRHSDLVERLRMAFEGAGHRITHAQDALEALAKAAGVPLRALGETGGDRLLIRLVGQASPGATEDRGAGVADDLDEPLDVLRDAWEHGLARALGDDGWRPEPREQEG